MSRTNKQLTLKLDELNDEHKKLKGDHEIFAKSHNDLLAKHDKLNREHEQLNSSYKELEKLSNKKVPSNTPYFHDGSTCVVKVNASTSCFYLLSMPCSFSCDNMSTLVAILFKKNEKLKMDNAKLMDGWKRYTKGKRNSWKTTL